MGAAQPYMYSDQRGGSRFPEAPFDPKAVTRASWEPKRKKPQQNGPLVSFNRHPDAHMVLATRSGNFSSMSPRTKQGIKWMRRVQLLLRVVELNGAIGLLVLMVLITKVDAVTSWILRIAPGIVMAHCFYGAYHLSRDASARAPGSSAAYQLFATVADLCTLSIYAFGAYSVHQKSDKWATRLEGQNLMDYFVPAVYYMFVAAGGLHLLSLCLSTWLGIMFRKISLMPPDMNPLEDNLTARPKHKKSKSSISTLAESEKRLSTPLEDRRRSGFPYEDISRPPTVPFMHTRTQSRDSMLSRDSRSDLPSRQYQVIPGNASRQSVASIEPKRLSTTRFSQRGSYTELPLNDPSSFQGEVASPGTNQRRAAKFTETWMPTDSLISRTNQRNRQMAPGHARGSKSYSALAQRYNLDDSSDSEYDDENNLGESDMGTDLSGGRHPNPLRAHPPAESQGKLPRVKTPFQPRVSSLSEISTNERRVSESRDIADQKWMGSKTEQRNLAAPADPEHAFYSKPYGELKSATPPVMVGGDNNRNVSSGNDYDKHASVAYERRNVSGKIAEEGRAGDRSSRYRFLTGRT